MTDKPKPAIPGRRLGMYDREALMEASEDLVWDDLDEWLEGGVCE